MTHILLVVKTCLMHAHSNKATQAVHNYRFRALPTLCRSPTLTTDLYHYVIQNFNINRPDCVVSTNTNTTHQNRIDINTTLRVGYHVSLTAHISVRIRARVILKSVKFFSLVHISFCPLCIIALEWVQLPSMYDLSFLKLRGDHDSTFWSRTANANAQYVIENSKITAQPVCGKSPGGLLVPTVYPTVCTDLCSNWLLVHVQVPFRAASISKVESAMAHRRFGLWYVG